MKQEVVEYLIDSFQDFKGKEHKIIACAVSKTPKEYDEGYIKLKVGFIDEDGYAECDAVSDVNRVVVLGIAVCNPIDQYSEERGKKMAYHKAVACNNKPKLYATEGGVINKTLIKALLKQEMKFVKSNPHQIIKGYNESKARFDKRKELDKQVANLSAAEKTVVEMAVDGIVDMKKLVGIAKGLVDRKEGESQNSL